MAQWYLLRVGANLPHRSSLGAARAEGVLPADNLEVAWLLICEMAKSFYVVMFVIILTDDYHYGHAFKKAVAACLVCILSVTMFRLTALIKVCRSKEGLSSHSFNTYYYGTSNRCPFAAFMLQREKDRAPQLANKHEPWILLRASAVGDEELAHE